MTFGSSLEGVKCPRCKCQITMPAHYEYGEWYHQACWQKGAHQLADATKISEAVRRMQTLFLPIQVTEDGTLLH